MKDIEKKNVSGEEYYLSTNFSNTIAKIAVTRRNYQNGMVSDILCLDQILAIFTCDLWNKCIDI